MKKTETITAISIDQIIADTGRTKPVNNFHVFKSSELIRERRTTPLRVDHFVIILAIDGTVHIRLNLTDYRIEKNGLFIVVPEIIYEIGTETERNFIGMGFIPEFLSDTGISKKHADAFTFFSSQSAPHFQLNNEEAAILQQLLLILYDKDHTEKEHPFKEEVIHHAFNLFMYELAAITKKYRGEPNFKMTRKEDILISFFKILPTHFKEERSVHFYASQLFITPKHLTKTVKDLTHKTCGEWIDDMVIMEAKVLLNDFSLSVGNVAEHLHFSDQFFFSKFFKKHTGLTPTEFRTST